MRKRKSRYKSAKKGKGFKLNLNLRKIAIFAVIVLLLGYVIYAYIGFRNIKSENPLREGNANYYLLSRRPNDFKKTLIVFENELEGQERIEKVYLYAYNKNKESSILIYLPNWLLYKGLESDFGNAVAVSGFKYAGDFKQPGKGVEYAIWQIEDLLGMNVDEYIWFDSKSFLLLQENLGEIESSTAYSQYYQNGSEVSEDIFFLNGFVSRLNWLNLIFSANKFRDSHSVIYSSFSSLPNIVVEMKSINSSILNLKPYVIDLSLAKYQKQTEAEGDVGVVRYVNISEYDLVWRSNTSRMIDRKLERERVRVEVYNASGIAGKASSFARRIANSGCEVVRFDNAPSKESSTKFYVPNQEEFKYSLDIITELLPGQYELINGRPSFMTTGDIVIILGEDISSMYSF
jgi:hypothetical protein